VVSVCSPPLRQAAITLGGIWTTQWKNQKENIELEEER